MHPLVKALLFPTLAMIVYIPVIWATQPDPSFVTPLELPPRTEESPNRAWGVAWTQEDRYCLALNIYFEARSEPIEGQYAVADVTMYRTMHADYPDTICGVVQDAQYHPWNPNLPVRDKCQFSWFCDGKSDTPVDGAAFQTALEIATDVLTDPQYPGIIPYAIFYHAEYSRPNWAESMVFVRGIGQHLFYHP